MIATRPRPRSTWRGERDLLVRDGRRHVVWHRLHLSTRLSSAELDSTATVVIELPRRLFCLLSVGRPSLVCVSPARARLIEQTAPQPHMTRTPEKAARPLCAFWRWARAKLGYGFGFFWLLVSLYFALFTVLCCFPGTSMLPPVSCGFSAVLSLNLCARI